MAAGFIPSEDTTFTRAVRHAKRHAKRGKGSRDDGYTSQLCCCPNTVMRRCWLLCTVSALPCSTLVLEFGIGAATWLVLVNLLALALYASDKTAAQRKAGRVSELVLHLVAVAGGVAGAAWARDHFNHKTRKQSFDAVLLASTAAHWVGACLLVG